VIGATLLPLFDHADDLRVAALVGFDPDRDPDARECLLDSWDLTDSTVPAGCTQEQRAQAVFAQALGLWVWVRFGDIGREMPVEIREWYCANAAVFCGDGVALATIQPPSARMTP